MSSLGLVGHEAQLHALAMASERGRLGQAYLFVGPTGVGKRLAALTIAQGLLCEEPPGPLQACGKCAACRQVEGGTHPDVIEVGRPADKLELPIAVINDLRDRLGLKASRRGGRKIAIVDDGDSLNDEAANAFLKTLEEPPPGAVLIIIASAAESQLPTILSRCQLIRFGALTDPQLERILSVRPEIRAEMIPRLIGLGEGSVGRALEFVAADWTEVQLLLWRGLAVLPQQSVELTKNLHQFIEDGSKEAAQRRGKSSQVIQLAGVFYRQALRYQQGGVVTDPANEVVEAAHRLTPIKLMDCIDRCVEADYQIKRFLNQALVIDAWLDDLAQIADGTYVPIS